MFHEVLSANSNKAFRASDDLEGQLFFVATIGHPGVPKLLSLRLLSEEVARVEGKLIAELLEPAPASLSHV